MTSDPTDDWDCAPPRDDRTMEWVRAYVKQHVHNELHRVSWDERHKKIASASRKANESWVPTREER
tara:strand:- start:176 stop:373 length:198 start_codon:yes stop_codon:yes gene_type:complete